MSTGPILRQYCGARNGLSLVVWPGDAPFLFGKQELVLCATCESRVRSVQPDVNFYSVTLARKPLYPLRVQPGVPCACDRGQHPLNVPCEYSVPTLVNVAVMVYDLCGMAAFDDYVGYLAAQLPEAAQIEFANALISLVDSKDARFIRAVAKKQTKLH